MLTKYEHYWTALYVVMYFKLYSVQYSIRTHKCVNRSPFYTSWSIPGVACILVHTIGEGVTSRAYENYASLLAPDIYNIENVSYIGIGI